MQSRDYVTAYRRILPLANQGHAHAQYTVGFLYAFGRGVEQDYDVAVKWYRLAAEQGLAEAQIALGIMYESGTGVPRDLNESHRRYSLAVENLTPSKTRDTAIEQRDRVARLLSQERLATEQLNAAPTDIALSNNKVPENAPPGTLVGKVSARDPDAGDSLIYGLTEDAGGRFVIDPVSGALSVAEGAALDFETGRVSSARGAGDGFRRPEPRGAGDGQYQRHERGAANAAAELRPRRDRAKSYYQAGFYSRSVLDYLNAAISWL